MSNLPCFGVGVGGCMQALTLCKVEVPAGYDQTPVGLVLGKLLISWADLVKIKVLGQGLQCFPVPSSYHHKCQGDSSNSLWRT